MFDHHTGVAKKINPSLAGRAGRKRVGCSTADLRCWREHYFWLNRILAESGFWLNRDSSPGRNRSYNMSSWCWTGWSPSCPRTLVLARLRGKREESPNSEEQCAG